MPEWSVYATNSAYHPLLPQSLPERLPSTKFWQAGLHHTLIKEFLGYENLNTQNHYTDAAAELQKRQMAIQLTRFENVGRPDLLGPPKADA